jgi:hypothetical protein
MCGQTFFTILIDDLYRVSLEVSYSTTTIVFVHFEYPQSFITMLK